MVPSISKNLAIGDKEQVIKKVQSFLQITIIISLPCTVGLIIYSKEILNLLFPNANRGEILLQINAISIFFAMISQTINGVLQGIGKSSSPLIAFSIGLFLKFFANVFFISNPIIGIKGAAIGNIICNVMVFSIGFFCLKKNLRLKIEFEKLFLKPIFATLLMSVYAIILKILLKNIILKKSISISVILTSAMIYGATIATLRTIKTTQWKIFFKKKRDFIEDWRIVKIVVHMMLIALKWLHKL